MAETSPKCRPILFSSEMVRAILAGRKTMTRRVVKPGKWAEPNTIEICDDDVVRAISRETGCQAATECPQGKPGDRLWVREQWRVHGDDATRASTSTCTGPKDCEFGADFSGKSDSFDYDIRRPWRPSIHMPRWASRITLEIISVKVQRLQHISEEDATAEGFPGNLIDGQRVAWSAYGWFLATWQAIYGADSLHQNPLVWAITFKRVEGAAHG